MIALDTNVLARFYVDDPADSEAMNQREAARRLFTSDDTLFVGATVLLELEWVVRALYGFGAPEFIRLVEHLSSLPNVVVEERTLILDALDLLRAGLDFADALHLVRSERCTRMVTFDDRKFARRAQRLGTQPPVDVLK